VVDDDTLEVLKRRRAVRLDVVRESPLRGESGGRIVLEPTQLTGEHPHPAFVEDLCAIERLELVCDCTKRWKLSR
jgi:hypothetical protein